MSDFEVSLERLEFVHEHQTGLEGGAQQLKQDEIEYRNQILTKVNAPFRKLFASELFSRDLSGTAPLSGKKTNRAPYVYAKNEQKNGLQVLKNIVLSSVCRITDRRPRRKTRRDSIEEEPAQLFETHSFSFEKFKDEYIVFQNRLQFKHDQEKYFATSSPVVSGVFTALFPEFFGADLNDSTKADVVNNILSKFQMYGDVAELEDRLNINILILFDNVSVLRDSPCNNIGKQINVQTKALRTRSRFLDYEYTIQDRKNLSEMDPSEHEIHEGLKQEMDAEQDKTTTYFANPRKPGQPWVFLYTDGYENYYPIGRLVPDVVLYNYQFLFNDEDSYIRGGQMILGGSYFDANIRSNVRADTTTKEGLVESSYVANKRDSNEYKMYQVEDYPLDKSERKIFKETSFVEVLGPTRSNADVTIENFGTTVTLSAADIRERILQDTLVQTARPVLQERRTYEIPEYVRPESPVAERPTVTQSVRAITTMTRIPVSAPVGPTVLSPETQMTRVREGQTLAISSDLMQQLERERLVQQKALTRQLVTAQRQGQASIEDVSSYGNLNEFLDSLYNVYTERDKETSDALSIAESPDSVFGSPLGPNEDVFEGTPSSFRSQSPLRSLLAALPTTTLTNFFETT